MDAKRDLLDFDETSARRWLEVVRVALWPYFRPEVIGTDNLPAGRGLIIGCHSGVVPYDAAATLVAVHEATGRFARAVGDRFFGRLATVEDFLARQGAMIGTPARLEGALRAGHLVLLYPGGARDMERPYLSQRYRVLPHRGWARGRGGYIKVALRARAPIVPVALVGAEEAHVLLANAPRLAQLLGLPLVPFVLSPLPLPVKMIIRFGEPIALPGGPADAADQRHVDRLNTMVRRRLQALIDDTVHRRRGVFLGGYEDSARARRKSHAAGR
jgi:1-acyl-sn-glycerol-3-phosphate acyltransferase